METVSEKMKKKPSGVMVSNQPQEPQKTMKMVMTLMMVVKRKIAVESVKLLKAMMMTTTTAMLAKHLQTTIIHSASK